MSTTTSNQLDLRKLDLRKQIVLDLVKSKGLDGQRAQVALAIDRSGSMSNLYNKGVVQDTIERIVPIAMQFDDNQEFELFVFSGDCKLHNNVVTVNNAANIVNREISKYEYGGTNYAPVIYSVMEHYLKAQAGKTSLLGKLFGSKSKPEYDKSPLPYPVYVIFITDGENGDKEEAKEAIKEAANYGIFFQFVGIGDETFKFLQKLDELSGRYIDNANFFKIKDLEKISDDKLYNLLLTEFPLWVKEAKSKSLIV